MSTKIQQKEATVKIQTKQIKEATITAKLQSKQKEKIEKLAKKKGLLEIPCQSDKIISRIEHGRTI